MNSTASAGVVRLRSAVAACARVAASFLLCSLVGVAAAQDLKWVARGPAPTTKGQVENVKDGEVVGAVNAVAPHPTDKDAVYIGAVNGGIWKTANATAASPIWEHQTDALGSLSIGALEFDPTDATHKTLVAGVGRFSSLGRRGGARSGLLRTTDGVKWDPLDGGGDLKGLNVSGVAPRGAVIVLGANAADATGKAGVWRSTDTGAKWKQVSGGAKTGLPAGPAACLAGDPANPKRLFTNAGSAGLFRSHDAGETWEKVGSPALNNLIGSAGNVKVVVGRHDNVYAAVVVSGELAGVFRSANGGTDWDEMDLPKNAEGGIHPGGQGGVHLSLAADPGEKNIVYIGGDRQDPAPGTSFPTPNSIGARDYSGRLFRGDASKAAGKQWVHLTHSNTMGAAGGGTGNGSAPHADSRGMRVAADGVLIEVNDGGVYRRTDPRTKSGDWFSMNGNLQVTEFHAVAWDPVSQIAIGGAQDTGTPEQPAKGATKWRSVTAGDGGVVAVDGTSTPGFSTRYSSYYSLHGFRRRVYDQANVLQSQDFPSLLVLNGGFPLQRQFYTPIRLNASDPTRLVIGGANSVYESLDQGDSLTEIGPDIRVNGTGPNPIAYGTAGKPDALYVGSFNRVFVRTTAGGALTQSAAYPGGTVMGIALDPADAERAYVVDPVAVHRTADAGVAWENIAGNLQTLAPGTLRCIAYSTAAPGGAVVVGSDNGVFIAAGPDFNTWARYGTDLPRVPVYTLEYAAGDRLLLAGTLGRGAWTLQIPAEANPPPRAPAAGQRKDGEGRMGPFQLRPGIVVAADRKAVYLMTPVPGVEAVDVSSGKALWATKEASRPLGVVGDRLLAQEEASEGGKLKVAVLDLGSGKPDRRLTLDVPARVRPTAVGTVAGDFSAVATPAAEGSAVVAWQFEERPKRAIPPDTPPVLPGTPAVVNPAPASRGTSKVNLTTGEASPVPAVIVDVPMTAVFPPIRPADRIPNARGQQFYSADRRHVTVSELTGKAGEWERYTLSVYEAGGEKRKVGEFKSHTSVVPFFVSDGLIVFETPPFTRREGAESEPAKLRAIDLRSGKEIWNREVRETVYRGPFPP